MSDGVLQKQYGLSSGKLMLYKTAAKEIVANRPTNPKPVRKIGSRQFLEDIKSGMSDRDLMAKYDLDQRQLRKLFGKVISTGLATLFDLADWRVEARRRERRPRKILLRIGWKKLAFSLLAVAVSLGALWLTNSSVTPKEASWDDVLQEAVSGGYRIMSTEQLAQRYKKQPQEVLLVDTRQDWEFNAGHMQGAVHFPMEPTWWSRWSKRGSLRTALGPDKDRPIVFY